MVCTHYNMREQQDRLFIVYYHLEPSPIASEAQCLRQVGLLNTGSLTAENGFLFNPGKAIALPGCVALRCI